MGPSVAPRCAIVYATLSQPCPTCQTRFGTKRMMAKPKPSHGHGLARCQRALVLRSPISIATPSAMTVYFVSRPTPNTNPNSSHSLGFAPRSSRTNSKHATAQLCGNQRRDDNGRGAGQNREQSQRGQRTREDRLVEPGQQRGDRWVIDVPQCEMPTRGEVVELVAVPAVAVGDRHRHAHLGSDQQEQGCPGRACVDAAKLAQG